MTYHQGLGGSQIYYANRGAVVQPYAAKDAAMTRRMYEKMQRDQIDRYIRTGDTHTHRVLPNQDQMEELDYAEFQGEILGNTEI